MSKTVIFMISIAALSLAGCSGQSSREVAARDLPHVRHMVDTHIHLYDPTRPQGIDSWPPATDKILYRPYLPQHYHAATQGSGVTAAVIVEASPRYEDNRWVLDLVANDDYFIALVGRLDFAAPDFEAKLIEQKANPRFVGVRMAVPRRADTAFADEQVLSNVRVLARHGLSLDLLVNRQGIEGVKKVHWLAQQVPELRIIADHLLGVEIDGQPVSADWLAAVAELATNANVWVKVSGLYQRSVPQPAPQFIDHYRIALDAVWNAFGSDRLVYGSNWPVTQRSGEYLGYVRMLHSYFADKSPAECNKFYWQNANELYRLGLE